MFFKFFWALRAVFYSMFFGKLSLPGYIGRPIFLKGIKNIYISKRVRIFPQIRLETYDNGFIKINEDVSIGQNVHITSAGNLTIGKSSTILANVFITNIDHDYKEIGIHILKQKNIIQETYIGENCFIGIGACIQAGTILGKQCIVGANSVVRGKFEDFSVIAGVPGKIIKKYNNQTQNWEKTDSKGNFI